MDGLKAMQDIIDRMRSEGASPEDIDAALVEYSYRHEQSRKASPDIEVPPAPDETTAQDCFEKAYRCFERYEDDEAVRLLRRALLLDPRHYDSRRMLVQIEAKGEETVMAELLRLEAESQASCLDELGLSSISELCDAWSRPSTRALARIKADLAFLAYDMGRYRVALRACEEVVAIDCGDHQSMRGLLMMLYVYFEDSQKADALLRSRQGEENCWFLLGRSVLSYKESDLRAAKVAFDRILELYPDFLIALSMFMNPEQRATMGPTGAVRSPRRDEMNCALEDAVAVLDTTPGYMYWLAEVYERLLFES